MFESNEIVTPVWPEALAEVDIVKLRFVLDFISPCTLQPANFLGLGRILKVTGRQSLDSSDALAVQQWESLFQPSLSADPVARRKFQKPAPAFVLTMPCSESRTIEGGDHLDLEVLFLGTGIPLIHVFLRSMIHLGRLGLVAGEGHFEITEVYASGAHEETLIWREADPLASIACPVMPITWLLTEKSLAQTVTLQFVTPARLMVDGRPLRKPRFSQIFPFMLRRVTSMLHTHGGVEQNEDITMLVEQAKQVKCSESSLEWIDWRPVGQQNLAVGGFVGNLHLESQGLEELFWVLSVASLLGIGKGATYGAGQVNLTH